jgi:hypothetical protein
MTAQHTKPKAIDQKCLDLAEHFMESVKGRSPKHVRELAEAFQDAAEDHCSMAEADCLQEREDNGQFGVGA